VSGIGVPGVRHGLVSNGRCLKPEGDKRRQGALRERTEERGDFQ
jgi:hypothetical protein